MPFVPRIKFCFFMTQYCVGLLLVLDVIYSNFFFRGENAGLARVSQGAYGHGLASNYDGHNRWGSVYYPLYTNSFGLRDGAVRDIPARSDMRRVLLIGDSFTE